MENNKMSRRNFLKLSGLFGALLAFPKIAVEAAKDFCEKVGRFWLPKNGQELDYALKNAKYDDVVFLEPVNFDGNFAVQHGTKVVGRDGSKIKGTLFVSGGVWLENITIDAGDGGPAIVGTMESKNNIIASNTFSIEK